MSGPSYTPTAGRTRAELRDAGRALRKDTPRSSQADWTPAPDRDAVALLQAQDAARLPELVPVRYARMAASPFAFYRGAAAVMAADLAATPATGVVVQACGDAHLLKEAVGSVLAGGGAAGDPAQQGRRVVEGQQLMQAFGDRSWAGCSRIPAGSPATRGCVRRRWPGRTRARSTPR